MFTEDNWHAELIKWVAQLHQLQRCTFTETKRMIARLQAQGKDVYAVRQKLLNDELSLLEKGTEEYLNKVNEIEVLSLEKNKEIADKRKQQREKELEEQKKEQERIAGIIIETRSARSRWRASKESSIPAA